MLNEDGEWVKKYLRSEGIFYEEEEEDFGLFIKEETVDAKEEKEAMIATTMKSHKGCDLNCLVKVRAEERKKVKEI